MPLSLRRAFVPVLLLVVTSASACERGGGAEDLSLLRDSAGIQIAENVYPDSAAIAWWTLSAEPELDIGGADVDEAEALFQVGAVHRLDDGRIVVAHGGGHDVRIYNAAGEHLRSIGRAGDGPGEFRRPSRVHVMPGDSLLVYDSQARRLTLLAPDGTYARDWPLQQPDGRPAALVGVFGDGSLVAQGNALFGSGGPPPTGRLRPDVTFFRVTPGEPAVDTIAVAPGAESFVRTNADASGRITSMQIMTLPFGRTAAASVGEDQLVIGTQDRPELRFYSQTGVVLRILRTGAPVRPVTPEHRDAWVERQIRNVPPDQHAAVRANFAELPHGESVPPYGMVMLDDAGNTWLQDYDDRITPAGGWTVYDRSGRILARVQLPSTFRPHHIGADFVLGVEHDEMDVERVRLYRLERGAARAS